MQTGTPKIGGKSVDIRVSSTLIDGTIGVLAYLREAVNGVIFELFVRSINTAN